MPASKKPRKRYVPKSHPLKDAIQKAKADAEYKRNVTSARISMYMMDDGDDATEVLATLAIVIGTPCMAGHKTLGRDTPWVRQLHGALRSIQSICLDGYRWKKEYTATLNRAVEIATEHDNDTMNMEVFADSWADAAFLAEKIINHKVTMQDVE